MHQHADNANAVMDLMSGGGSSAIQQRITVNMNSVSYASCIVFPLLWFFLIIMYVSLSECRFCLVVRNSLNQSEIQAPRHGHHYPGVLNTLAMLRPNRRQSGPRSKSTSSGSGWQLGWRRMSRLAALLRQQNIFGNAGNQYIRITLKWFLIFIYSILWTIRSSHGDMKDICKRRQCQGQGLMTSCVNTLVYIRRNNKL